MSEGHRHLVVLRHAKSDWPAGVADEDRPLGRRGLRDASAAGRWLVEHDAVPEMVWCSPARRTRQTWATLSAEIGPGDGPEVRFDPRVYDASLEDLLAVVRDTPPSCGRVLLVGHNPGVQELVLALARAGSDDARALAAAKYPTSALAVLELTAPWGDVAPGSGQLSSFAVPRG
jgi:phosphohistidine phosphatase